MFYLTMNFLLLPFYSWFFFLPFFFFFTLLSLTIGWGEKLCHLKECFHGPANMLVSLQKLMKKLHKT